MGKILRAAYYCRVSTESQAENYSIPEQRERLEAFCKAKGWGEPRAFVDAGFSGGNMNRPSLRLLIDCISRKEFDVVVVYKLDRLSRSQKDTLYLIEDVFNKFDVGFVSVCENFDTLTPFGKAMIGILSVFAQLEKDQITERFTMGRIARAKSGLYHGGSMSPCGYDYIDGKLIINEYEAAQVRECYDLFMRGKSITAIQTALSEKYGGWSHTAVYHALKNSVYIGKVKFAGEEYEGQHAPIIPREQFYEVQRLLSVRSLSIPEARKTPFRAGFLLSGIVYCGNCGAKYHGNHGYYKCYSRAKCNKKYIVDSNCKNPNFTISELDAIVKAEIGKMSTNPKALTSAKPKRDNSATLRASIISALNNKREQQQRLIELYQLGKIPINTISEKIQALEREQDKLQEQLAAIPERQSDEPANFKELVKSSKLIFSTTDIEQQRLFVSTLIRRITIEPDKSVTIEWRL